LALADAQWKVGRLQARVKRRAQKIISEGLDLRYWPDPALREKRRRVLEALARRLRLRMRPPRTIRLRHPCDWKLGEHVLWRTVDGRRAALRVVGFDPRWGGGGGPAFELVGTLDARQRVSAGDLVSAQPRPGKREMKLASGRRWRGARFVVGVFQPGGYSADRVKRVPSQGLSRRPPIPRGAAGLSWLDLDGFLLRAFDLPWARGSVLRLSIGRRSVSLIVVDISTGFGAPETLCLVLDSNGTIRRTSETIRRIRTRIIDPGSLPSLAAHRRQFGVRDLDEPIPYRVRPHLALSI
jgi:hypothetical protein